MNVHINHEVMMYITILCMYTSFYNDYYKILNDEIVLVHGSYRNDYIQLMERYLIN